MAYEVLIRNANGLGIPLERMGLSWWGPDGKYYGPEGTYPGGVKVANTPEEVNAAMLRRHLIAQGGIVLAGALGVGALVEGLGELLDDPGELSPVSLPSRLSHGHVVQVRDMTRRLGVSDTGWAAPEMAAATAALATRLLDVPGPEPITRALMVAVAELRIEAGWAAFDAGLYRHTLYHYALALELAVKAEDAYLQVLALRHAGLAIVEHGHPDDGLKMLQAAQVKAWDIPSDDQRAVVVGVSGRAAAEACALQESATALACLGDLDRATARSLSVERPLHRVVCLGRSRTTQTSLPVLNTSLQVTSHPPRRPSSRPPVIVCPSSTTIGLPIVVQGGSQTTIGLPIVVRTAGVEIRGEGRRRGEDGGAAGYLM